MQPRRFLELFCRIHRCIKIFARNNWSIGGDNVDNLFASIAVMLMLTVVPNMIFNAWRIRREQKELGH